MSAPARRLRLFFAVSLSDEVRRALGASRPADGAYRWVAPELLHVTLAFLGATSEERLADALAAGRAAAAAARPFELRLGAPGSFGPRRAPSVLWVGLDGDLAALHALHAALAEALRARAFPVEERPFAPHVTLARRRRDAAVSPQAAWPPAPPPRGRFTVDALALVRSDLSPRGPSYTALERFALSG